MRFLVVIPVFNEAKHIAQVLGAVRAHAQDILVIDDGSTDATPRILGETEGVRALRHETNRGYGASLADGLRIGGEEGYEAVVTMDCDGQHEPCRIGELLAALPGYDIVSGSRYLVPFADDTPPPQERLQINQQITAELNAQLRLGISDAFCGFKAYGRRALQLLEVREPGYAMPMDVWAQVVHHGLRLRELAVPRIYLPEKRAFGGPIDDPAVRLSYYRRVLREAMERWPAPVSIEG